MTRRAAAGAVALVCLALAPAARAQGLLWSLPEDGAFVVYGGRYQQVELPADAAPEDVTAEYDCDTTRTDVEVLCWQREIWIGSVGRKEADFRGEAVPCRWIEIRTTTGVKTETGIDPGAAGRRIYKVLVPESAVTGRPVYEPDGAEAEAGTIETVPVAFLPIVEGYRQIGEGPVEELPAGVLQPFPVLTLLDQYRQYEQSADAAGPAIPLGPVAVQTLTADKRAEDRTTRTTNTATLWRSEEVPFGLAGWKVTLVREAKDSTAPRDEFAPVTKITVEMKANVKGTDAQSLLGKAPAAPMAAQPAPMAEQPDPDTN